MMSIEILKRARQYIEQGDTNAADSLLAGMSVLSPGPDVLVLRAQSAQRQNRDGEAERLLRRAVEGTPDHAGARVALARLALQKGEGRMAVEVLDGLSPEAKTTRIHKLRAKALIQNGDPLGAAETLSNAFHGDRNEVLLGRKAVKLYWASGARREAADLAAEILRIAPEDDELRRLRMRVLLAEDDQEAIAAEGAALATADAKWGMRASRRLLTRQNLIAAATVYLAIGEERDGTEEGRELGDTLYKRLMAQSREAAAAADPAAPISPLRMALRLRPQSREPQRELTQIFRDCYAAGVQHAKEGRQREALHLLALAVECDDSHRNVWLWLAKTATEAEQWPLAISALQHLRMLHPEDAAVARRLARTAEKAGDFLTALQTEKALALGGDETAAAMVERLIGKIVQQTRSVMSDGNLADAQGHVAALQAIDPANAKIIDLKTRVVRGLFRSARQAKQSKDFGAAVDAAQRAIELAPESTENLALLADTYRAAKRYEPAAEAYRRWLAAEPDNARGWLALAHCARKIGAGDEARAAAERAQALDPHSVAVQDFLAILSESLSPTTAPPSQAQRRRRRNRT